MILSNRSASEIYVPDLHPEWLIKWWYASPVSRFDPHFTTALFLLVLGFAIGGLIYIRRRQKQKEIDWQEAHHEKQFQELNMKKKIAMQKILDLEEAYKRKELSKEVF